MDAKMLALIGSFLGETITEPAPATSTDSSSTTAATSTPSSNNTNTASQGVTSTHDTKAPIVQVICFSKDRAFQLSQYLHSFDSMVVSSQCIVQIAVLWTASTPALESSYCLLAQRWPHVVFVEEFDFANQVRDIAEYGVVVDPSSVVNVSSNCNKKNNNGNNDNATRDNTNNIVNKTNNNGMNKSNNNNNNSSIDTGNAAVGAAGDDDNCVTASDNYATADDNYATSTSAAATADVPNDPANTTNTTNTHTNTTKQRRPPSHVLFNVDDAFYFRPVDLDACVSVLDNEPLVWTYHLKLFRGATYCQPAGRSMQRPQFTSWDYSKRNSFDVQSTVLFDLGLGDYDWNYPWDLSGSLYRSCDVLRVLDTVVDDRISVADSADQMSLLPRSTILKATCGHPNLLESACHHALQRTSWLKNEFKWSACVDSERSHMAVITINSVQEEMPNVVCQMEHIDTSIEGLDSLLYDNVRVRQLDSAFYRRQRFNSVHVGAFILKPDVDVILPVHNGEAYIESALTSLLTQTTQFPLSKDNFSSIPQRHARTLTLRVIVVDDCSTDCTLLIVHEMESHDPRIMIVSTHQHQSGHSEERGTRNNSPAGVAAALNRGLEETRNTPFVARMDADDVCAPHRLITQVQFLEAHPNVAVVGSNVKVVGPDFKLYNCGGDKSCSEGGKVTDLPTDPALVAWTMPFNCSMVHPSVMFRSDAIRQLGGYDTDALPLVEDLDLWLRCIEQGLALVNIPEVLLYLRKHDRNISRMHRSQQALHSAILSREYMRRILMSTTATALGPFDLGVVQLLRGDHRQQHVKSSVSLFNDDIVNGCVDDIKNGPLAPRADQVQRAMKLLQELQDALAVRLSKAESSVQSAINPASIKNYSQSVVVSAPHTVVSNCLARTVALIAHTNK